MALQYVGGNSNTGTGATISVSLTALTGGLSSSAAAGDVVVVVWGWSAAGNLTGVTLTENSGTYSYAFSSLRGNDTRDSVARMAYKVMGGTPDSACVVDGPNNSAYGAAACVQVWRGANTTSPLTGTASGASGTDSNHGDPPSITPAVNDSVVIVGMIGSGASTATGTKTAPTDYTSYHVTTKGDGSGADSYGAISARLLSGGGGSSTDPGAYSGGDTTTSDAWCAGTLALKPLLVFDGTASLPAVVSITPAGLAWVLAGASLPAVAELSTSGDVTTPVGAPPFVTRPFMRAERSMPVRTRRS